MRSKLIITGAVGVLAAATLTVNAQTSAPKTTRGSVATLLAASTHIARTDRDDVTIATRVAASAAAAGKNLKAETDESEKPDADKSSAPRVTLSTSCQTAITALKAAHQTDVAEDARERTTVEQESAAAIAAERSEDAAETQRVATALTAARTACAPQIPTACKASITGLESVLQTLRSDELSEPRTGTESFSDGSALRAAFAAVAAACLRS